MSKKSLIRVGIIGCGNISNAYFSGIAHFPELLRIDACADLDLARAAAKAAEHGVARSLSVDDILSDPEIDLIINLTIPIAHGPVNIAALRAGKHVYCEKPFATDREQAMEILELAAASGLRAGTAPDTFLGAGLQTCRHLIDTGAIGTPVAATAFMVCRGHENWHPSPEFYYQKGGGPLFDMGPYYITALVDLLGPVRRVCASARTSFPTRTITSEPLNGTVIPVETPTHYSGTLDFFSGAIASVIMSFDVVSHHLPCLEIHGSEGSLSCPDPNNFHDENSIKLRKAGQAEWEIIPLEHTHRTGRGMGVADMAMAIQSGREHRCSASLGAHVLEVMMAFEESSNSGKHVTIQSQSSRPTAVPTDLAPGVIDG